MHHLICRIDGDGVIKVADFGLTEDMYGANYHRHVKDNGGNEEKMPIRWMAPESIETDLYSESTDVVSYHNVGRRYIGMAQMPASRNTF